MTHPQLFTLIAGCALALASLGWAVAEAKRDARRHRFALLAGQLGGATLLVVLVATISLGFLVALVFGLGLVPKGAPGLFAATLGWLSVVYVAMIIGGISVQVRKRAKGWITLVDDDTIKMESGETCTTVRPRAGGAQLYFVEGAPQFVQFVIRDDAGALTFWGAIGMRGMRDVTEGVTVERQGLMLAGSAEPIRKWLSRFLATGQPQHLGG